MAPRRSKTALVLASGGIAGVSYEVGALRALDHILVDRTVNDFDIYVGTSAGALVSACVANGMPPVMLAGLVAGTVPGFRTMGRLQLYRPNLTEAANRMRRAPGLLLNAAAEYWKFRDRMSLGETIYSLAPLLPSGFFINDGVDEYLTETFALAGLSNDFRDLARELHIIAADIESDQRVAFSRFSHPNVPISQAVSASTSIPILFKPVEIDGHHYVDGGIKGQAAVDVAIARGAKLIVVVNGLVPLDTEAIRRRGGGENSIIGLGVRAIANQVIRGMLHDSLLDHLKAVRERHPDIDIVLIEPRPDDEKMFFHEVLSFSARLIVLQHGYETVTTGLQQSWPYLSRILPKHGFQISRKIIDRKPPELPVKQMTSTGSLVGWLRHTVLDHRGDAHGDLVASTVKVPGGAAPRQRRVAAGERTPAPRAAAGGRAFRPRVVSSDGDS